MAPYRVYRQISRKSLSDFPTENFKYVLFAPIHMDIQKYKRVDITLPSDLLKRFEEYCEKEGMKISSRMAVLIKKER